MKIISWNIGNFIFAKYFPGRKHYCFHIPDMQKASEMIKKEPGVPSEILEVLILLPQKI